MNPEIESLLKEYDEWMDKNSKTPESAKEGKDEIRRQVKKIPMDSFKVWALKKGLSALKKMGKK